MKTKIEIQKYTDDPSLSWEERYKRLESHHLEETQFLIKEIEKLEKEVASYQKLADYYHFGEF
jgi:hypothetical protein